MPDVAVTFQGIVQDSQKYGSDDDHMVSRLWVDIEVDGHERGSYFVDLKQVVGGNVDDIEVSPPRWNEDEYRGPWSQGAFAPAARTYFLEALRRAYNIVPHRQRGQRTTMKGNRIDFEKRITFKAGGTAGTW